MKYATSTDEHTRFSYRRARRGLRSACQVVIEMVREIFDEAAYERFLTRNRKVSSPAAYAHFLEEQDPGRKPRCC